MRIRVCCVHEQASHWPGLTTVHELCGRLLRQLRLAPTPFCWPPAARHLRTSRIPSRDDLRRRTVMATVRYGGGGTAFFGPKGVFFHYEYLFKVAEICGLKSANTARFLCIDKTPFQRDTSRRHEPLQEIGSP